MGLQKYISRLTELGRVQRRHSSFWVGLYGYMWVAGMEFLSNLVKKFWQLTPNKLPNFQQGLRAMELIQSSLWPNWTSFFSFLAINWDYWELEVVLFLPQVASTPLGFGFWVGCHPFSCPKLQTSKHRPITIAIAATLSGDLTQMLEVKNKGSLRKRNLRSGACCCLYSCSTWKSLKSWELITFVARINRPDEAMVSWIAVGFLTKLPASR